MLASMFATTASVTPVDEGVVAPESNVEHHTYDEAAALMERRRKNELLLSDRPGVRTDKFSESVVLILDDTVLNEYDAEAANLVKTVAGRYFKIVVMAGSPVFRQDRFAKPHHPPPPPPSTRRNMLVCRLYRMHAMETSAKQNRKY